METRYRGKGQGPSTSFKLPHVVGPYNGTAMDEESPGRGRGKRVPDDPLFPKYLTLPLICLFVGLVFAFVKFVDNRLPEIISEAESSAKPMRYC